MINIYKKNIFRSNPAGKHLKNCKILNLTFCMVNIYRNQTPAFEEVKKDFVLL
jgi:hypothetical protein